MYEVPDNGPEWWTEPGNFQGVAQGILSNAQRLWNTLLNIETERNLINEELGRLESNRAELQRMMNKDHVLGVTLKSEMQGLNDLIKQNLAKAKQLDLTEENLRKRLRPEIEYVQKHETAGEFNVGMMNRPGRAAGRPIGESITSETLFKRMQFTHNLLHPGQLYPSNSRSFDPHDDAYIPFLRGDIPGHVIIPGGWSKSKAVRLHGNYRGEQPHLVPMDERISISADTVKADKSLAKRIERSMFSNIQDAYELLDQ